MADFGTGGRNYETYSEDPVVLGLLSAAYVNGKFAFEKEKLFAQLT